MFAKAEDRKKAVKFGSLVRRSSFAVRFFILYVPVWFVLLLLLLIIADSSENSNFLFAGSILDFFGNNAFAALVSIGYLGLFAAIIPYFVERSNRKWRRANGWSVYKSVEEDYQRMLKKQEIKLENEAKQELGITEDNGVVDKTDIRYWHGLLEDGIIDQAEFDRKKGELV